MQERKIIAHMRETERRFEAVVVAFEETEGKLATIRGSLRELYVWSKSFEAIVFGLSDAVEAARKRSWLLRWLLRGLDLTFTREKAAAMRAMVEGKLSEIERRQAEERAREPVPPPPEVEAELPEAEPGPPVLAVVGGEG